MADSRSCGGGSLLAMSDDTPTEPTERDEGEAVLRIEIQLREDDPLGLHSLLGELPFFGVVGGWDNFSATVTEADGSVRGAKEEARTGEDPIYVE